MFGRILYMIAHGANGCIYNPPLRCITKFKLKHKPTMSKYNVRKDMFWSELQGQRLMDRADPSLAFHVPAETCPMANTAANKDAANQCLALIGTYTTDHITKITQTKHHINTDLIQSRFAGISLMDLLTKEEHLPLISSAKWQHSLGQWLTMASMLNRAGIQHGDWSPQNVLYDSVNNRWNLIDFDLVTPMDQFYKLAQYSDKWYHPLEAHLYGIITRQLAIDGDLLTERSMTPINQFVKRHCRKWTSAILQYAWYLMATEGRLMRSKEWFRRCVHITKSLLLLTTSRTDNISANINSIDEQSTSTNQYKSLTETKYLPKDLKTSLTAALGQVATRINDFAVQANLQFTINALRNRGILRPFNNKHMMSTDKQMNPTKTLSSRRCSASKRYYGRTRRCVQPCPKDTKEDYETGDCVPFVRKTSANTKVVGNPNLILIPDTNTSIKCPSNKVYNPYTRRCIRPCGQGKTMTKGFKCVRQSDHYLPPQAEKDSWWFG